MLWALLAPIGVMIFQGPKESVPWFFAYIVMTAVSGFFDYYLAYGADKATGLPLQTIAVFFVLKLVFNINFFHIIQSGGGSVATLIVSQFGESSGNPETQALLAAGFFLFAGTLLVNILANLIVRRTGRIQS